MPKIAFLLGAGASYPFGIPMMRQFYEEFLNYVGGRRSHCRALIDKLIAESEPQQDLEVLIQRLETVRGLRAGLGILGQPADHMAADLQLADELRGYLDAFITERCERFDQSKVSSKLTRFVKCVDVLGAYVFTTNYDCLIEAAAAEAGCAYSDGFQAPSSRPESRWTGDFNTGFLLLKLHGSVNWYEEDGSEELFRLERGFPLPSYEYRLTHGARVLRPLMIIPTLEKSVLRRPYAGLFTKFSDALNEVDLLVVIGNSLRDEHIRNTIIERAPRLNVVLINPTANAATGIVKHPDRTFPIPIGFDGFIDIMLDEFTSELRKLPSFGDSAAIAGLATRLGILAESAAGLTDTTRSQLEYLRHGPTEKRLEVLASLSASSHSLLVDEAKEIVLKGSDESIRVAAIDALANVSGDGTPKFFSQIVRSDAPLMVRAEAALALKSLTGPTAQAILGETTKAVENDRSVSVLFD
jgi:NAD-dependent SIR2 family protein deacetylase